MVPVPVLAVAARGLHRGGRDLRGARQQHVKPAAAVAVGSMR